MGRALKQANTNAISNLYIMDGFCFKETIEIVIRGPDGEIKDRSVIERTPGTVSKADAERLIKAKLEKSLKEKKQGLS